MKTTRAFTLVELLLATVLTTMLMIGVMAVVARLGAAAGVSTKPQALEGALDDATLECAVRLLRDDLASASSVDQTRPGELALTGFVALDSRNRQRTQRPTRVVYKIDQVNGRGWLIRTQAPLDVPANQALQRDLVWGGVSRFELVKSTDESDARAPQAPAPLRTTWRLHIWTPGRTEPLFDGLVAVKGASQP